MNTYSLWHALRTRLGELSSPKRNIVVQHLGLADSDVSDFQAVFDKIGVELGVTLELRGHGGKIVLLDVPFAARMSPQLLHALTEDRPVILIAGLKGEDEQSLSPAERFERRQRVLLRQLKELPLLRRHASRWPQAARAVAPGAVHQDGQDGEHEPTVPHGAQASNFDTGFDSKFDAEQLAAEDLQREQQRVLAAVLRGLADPNSPVLSASYGPGANLRFDFRARLVTIDPLAQQHLRVRRELPQLAPGAVPQADAPVRELDQTAWDLGQASGLQALLNAPADWWHAPLLSPATAGIDRYSRIPRHLDLARLLVDGPVTPSELRRQARVSVSDLRRFLQACLVLGLVQWLPASPAHGPH